jgi:pSer/pThr/pTyr-binding forkhead associated (FHA) protein
VITCPSCRKQNQDHYKFCLGCGAELPRPGASAPSVDETAPIAVPRPEPKAQAEQTPARMGMGSPVPPAQPAKPPIDDEATMDGFAIPVGGRPCPSCAHPNPPTNRFCASCGHRLDEAPAAKAPAPTKIGDGRDASGYILTALSPDGVESGTYSLPKGPVTVGRDAGGVFGTDSYLSRRHATFVPGANSVIVRDEGSLNGIFLKLQPEQRRPLAPGQVFRLGQELLEFQPLTSAGADADGVEQLGSPVKGYVGRIAMVLGRKSRGAAFPVPENGLSLGRERGEVLFSDDGYVSGLHCRISHDEGQIFLTDLGSSNGTFVRLMAEEKITPGDILLMGQQLFRLSS